MLNPLRALTLAALLAGHAQADDAKVPAAENLLSWNTTQAGELLPQSSVIAMVKSRNGYLWLGTMKGLVRFDGLKADVFDPLGSTTVVHLFEDSRGGLWVGTEKNGVALIKDGNLTSVIPGGGNAGSKLVSACEDVSGAVWLCTADGRVSRYRNGNKENDWALSDFGAGGYRAVMTENSGQMWIASAGLLSRVTSDTRATDFALELQRTAMPMSLQFVSPARAGGYWRFYNGRIALCSTNAVVRDVGAYAWDQSSTPVTAVCEDGEGNLYVGTYGDGVFCYDRAGRVTRIASPTLNHNTVLSLCVDDTGCLWIGTNGGGLNRVRRSLFETHPDTSGKVVQSACDDGAGGLWIGLNGDPVNTDAVRHWSGGVMKQYGPAQGLQNPYVRAVFMDGQKNVWAGGIVNGGLYQFSGGRFRMLPGTETLTVSALFQDRATNLWIGSERGLARWDGASLRLFTQRDGLGANSVRALAQDVKGDLWIGTDGGGLSCLRNGTIFNIRTSKVGLPGDSITALLADADGVLWVGTAGNGMGRLQNDKWTRFTKREGLAGNSITYLIEDGHGALWIGSNDGLMRVEKNALNVFANARPDARVGAINVRTFGKADGLLTKECTTGSQPAACLARDGRLWFPTTSGLVGVYPASLFRNTNPPPVHIEAVLVDDEPQGVNPFQVNWRDDVVIPARKEMLEVHFSSLNLAAPGQTRFRYRLEDFENWQEPRENMRLVRYSKLPHGRYRFQVTACNEDGVWNPVPATLGIVVEPPFWKTWWFQTALVLFILGAIIGTVYFIATQRLQRQLVELQKRDALEKERARIARDLHDQLGANLTQVSLLGELVETDKDLPDEVEQHAKQICNTARETSTALDEIVWSANPKNDTLEGLVNYACKYAQDYLRVAGLRYRLDVPSSLPATDLPPELRHNVFLAFKESVNNVVKHAKATEVAIRLKLERGMFAIEIEDNGRGPAEAKSKSGRNGLKNMRKRMEDVGGKFVFEPAPERGTRVKLIAPVGKVK